MSFAPATNIINSKDHLFEIVKSVREYRLHFMLSTGLLVCEMYRGQGRVNWPLRPNLARNLKDEKEARDAEKAIVLEFNKELTQTGFSKSLQTSFLHSPFHTEWLLLEQSQHYRIPTRFMDWTINWEVALFFAVSNPDDDDFDAQFWIYIVPPGKLAIDDASSDYLNFDPFEFEHSIFLNSSGFLSDGYLDKIAERRKTRQNGRFCIQPYNKIFTPLEDQDEHKSNLTNIVIPKKLKGAIRNQLTELNYTNETLYVTEDKTINDIVQKLRAKYKV